MGAFEGDGCLGPDPGRGARCGPVEGDGAAADLAFRLPVREVR